MVRHSSARTVSRMVTRLADLVNRAPSEGCSGSVTLVGAGPGGADLITVRGARALAEADVVVHDRLADPALLELASVHAERVPVGKGKGFGVTQEEICSIIVNRSASGKRVVRLKGGDPFVFGRGAEELDALDAAGIAWTVVPGITSALGAPALAGISLTDRRGASSFTVLSGHRASDAHNDWKLLAASSSTLVVLMAASTAADVARCLQVGGRPGDEPVAFVHAAGTAGQDQHLTTLTDAAIDGCPFPSPTTMIVGRAASSRRTPASTTREPHLHALHR